MNSADVRDAARNDRSRRLRYGIATSFLSRGAAAAGPVLIIPIILPYVGPTLFGVWATALAVSAVIAWSDLGLGSSLVTRLTVALDRGYEEEARRLVANAYAAVAAVALVLVTAPWVGASFVRWEALAGVREERYSDDSHWAVLAILTCFALNVLASLVHRVLYAMQRVSLSNILIGVGNALSLVSAAIAVSLDAPVLLVMILSVSGPLVANTFTTVWVFAALWAEGRPTFKSLNLRFAWRLVSFGSQFLLVSVLTTVSLSLDPFIIARVVGPNLAGEYAVYARLLGALGLAITLVNSPLWPIQGEALSRGDLAWVRGTTVRMVAFSSASVALGALAILAIRDPLFGLLTHSELEPSAGLVAVLGVWWVLVASVSPLFMVQNAAGVLRPQMAGWALFAVASLTAKVMILRHGGSLWAVVGVGAVSYAALVLPSAILGYRRSLSLVGPR